MPKVKGLWEFLLVVLQTLYLYRKLFQNSMFKKRKGRNGMHQFGIAIEEEW